MMMNNNLKEFAEGKSGIDYCIPLSCKCFYMEETGRCVNDHLREHRNNCNETPADCLLEIHWDECACALVFDKSSHSERATA